MTRVTIETANGRIETTGAALERAAASLAAGAAIGGNAQAKLRSLVERIERLNEDKAAVLADLKEVYLEAKGEGFDTKILRAVVRRRAADAAKLSETEALIERYLDAIGR